ncbi:MAG TPA: Ig-like domain-containing protein [Thermodesulfovibrionales bacterium]|nr:Ig-like domain-containing protein [Thermodesulfovibrionales bacterium]
MKKRILLLTLLAISLALFGCGGNEAGGLATPPGNNPGVPSVVKLLPLHFVAQTNSTITLQTMVLDGDGRAVPNIPVTYTNLSIVGVLSSTRATTDSFGVATVTLYSTTGGFATVQAEVNTGSGNVRDQKTVVFSSFSVAQLTPTLTLDVDDGDGVFNETGDFILFKTTNDNTREIRATVSNGAFLISGTSVTFASDRPYKVGTDPAAKCSDESAVCDVIFPNGNVKTTDGNGQAETTVQVVPTSLTSIQTTLNITAQSDTGAFNMVSLFLQPVTVNTITVSGPTTVDSAGTGDYIANATTTAGTPVPDGTTINFTTTAGSIDPFAQTPNNKISGTAKATFTAPTVTFDTAATITASVGGKSASTSVTIKAPVVAPPALTVTPAAQSAVCGGGPVTFIVTGGTGAGYKATSLNPSIVTVSAVTSGQFTATVPDAGGCTAAGLASGNSLDVSIAVEDNASPSPDITTAKVTVSNP